jgi:predicted KAP-like P-loop ATPase
MTNSKSSAFGGGERPITDANDDKLSRGGFVERITEALITDDGKAARGVVIGVTGPWGSGKSSILNLVDEEIRRRAPQAVVVRFDPWIISGQQDLILSFLRETIRTIEAEPERAKRARKLLDGLTTYAAYLAPVFNAAIKNSGDVTKAVLEALNKKVKGDQSLTGQRQKLEELIVSLGVPVVVLIDELDRVEDDEVRAVAQLVRAVGDFSGISYVLAYDPRRVAQALGRGDDKAASAHGRAYLEKIVQLPLALPVALPGELRAILDAELNQAFERLKLTTPVGVSLRYEDIAEAITPRLATTPRDIKRLVGIFHPLMAMVKAEVDPIDVLGFSALMAKAPLTVERISTNPNVVVDDPLTFDEALRRSESHGSDGVGQVVVEPEASILVTLLFPALAGRRRMGSHHEKASRRS